MKREAAIVLALAAMVLILACGGIPPINPPTQPCEPMGCYRELDDPRMCDTESGDCVACPTLEGAIWNADAGEVTCSTPERPVKHWPETEECPILTEACAPPPLPRPQCILEDGCDCYREHEWVECPVIPPGECVFPGEGDDVGDHWRAYTPSQKPTRHYDEYRKGLAAVGDTCGEHPMESLRAIAAAITEQGVCAKQLHDAVTILRPSDGLQEEWHAVFFGNGCAIEAASAHKATWRYLGPKVDDCPLPHPNVARMKFNTHERGSYLDTTWTTVGQCEFCDDIGLGEYGGLPRCGCPVRPECSSGVPPDAICHDRAACEAELCGQKWECGGEPREGYRGNPAQTNCRGHWKTWCSATGSTAVAEGYR